MKNPFKLGPPGIMMLALWVVAIGVDFWWVFQNRSTLTSQPSDQDVTRLAVIIQALLLFGLLWLFLLATAPLFSRWTLAWARTRNRPLDSVFSAGRWAP